MVDINNNAFAKGLSSVFIISSPLQVLCTLEVITELQIKDYLIVFQCHEGEIRNEQVLKMLLKYKLNYITYYVNEDTTIKKTLLKSLFSNEKKFDRVCIGDYNNQLSLVIGYQYIHLNSYLMYLDDGIATIPILKGRFIYSSFKFRLRQLIISILYLFKFVSLNKYFFTLYYDIDTNIVVYPNKFSHILANENSSLEKKGLFFIGTNSYLYAERYLNGDEELYQNILFNILDTIKKNNPDKLLYFIPHGRDNRKYIVDYCRNNDIIYMRLSESVESYFVSNEIYPECVYGFVSSALFNLKKIYPDSRVVNFNPVKSNAEWRDKNIETSLYYEKHGIEYRYIDADGYNFHNIN